MNSSDRFNKPTGTSNTLSTSSSFTRSRPWDFGEISLLVLFVFGTIGNLLSIVVVCRKRMRNTNASLFVTSIAVSDILVLFFKFAANMIKLYKIPIFNFCILIHNILPQTAMFASIWLIIITTLERAIAVLFPLNVAIVFSQRRCKVIIVCMVLFFFILSSTLSPCLEYYIEKPYYCQIKGNLNGTCYHYYSYVFPWVKSSLGSWIPSLLTFCLNIIIIKALYTASNKRKSIANVADETNNRKFSKAKELDELRNVQIKHLGGSLKGKKNFESSKSSTENTGDSMVKLIKGVHKNRSDPMFEAKNSPLQKQNNINNNNNKIKNCKERQITVMLITISISFLILSFPYSAFDLLRKLNVQWKFLKNREILRIVMLLVDINHATNFILYCLTGQKFRNEFKSIIVGLFTRKKELKFTATNHTNIRDNYKKIHSNIF